MQKAGTSVTNMMFTKVIFFVSVQKSIIDRINIYTFFLSTYKYLHIHAIIYHVTAKMLQLHYKTHAIILNSTQKKHTPNLLGLAKWHSYA